MIEDDERILLEGRAGYETPFNRGHLTLTDKRLIWEKSLSIDPFGDHEIALPLNQVDSISPRGDAIALSTAKGDVVIFPQFWMLSVITGGRRTKEWISELQRAVRTAKGEAASA
ncbi:MAG: hypothetical protein ABI559_12780 [Chloroflexota bacterium]